MEGFWAYGDLAQTIAFPFEVIGCGLVALEIFAPKVADGIEGWIDLNTSAKTWQEVLIKPHVLLFVLFILLTLLILAEQYVASLFEFVTQADHVLLLMIILVLTTTASLWRITKPSRLVPRLFVLFTLLVLADPLVESLFDNSYSQDLTVLMMMILSFMMGISLILNFNKLFSSLNKISYGKALGALGFFLALIGLTCELYQYIGLSLDQCRWFMSWVGACV